MEYLSSNGEMKIVQSLKDLPENMEIPLAILNHLDSLKKDEIIESVIPDSELQLAAEKALDKYRETWSCYQDKKIQFHEIFESVLTKATAEDAHKMQSLETGFKQELTATFAQYSAALKELAETHQAILQTIDKSEIAQILKQQRRELTECHQYWVTQLKDLNSHQKQEFELELNKIFRKINGEPVSECEGEEPSEAPEPQNANLTDQVQSKPAIAEPLSHSSIPQNEKVRSLQEMGFSISDAETALKITNSDLVL